MKIFLLLIIILYVIGPAYLSDWEYGQEDNWPDLCKTGLEQSPINIPPDVVKQKYNPLVLKNHDKPTAAYVFNNGHTVKIKLQTQNPPLIKGGCLPDVYVMEELHFHWDAEHAINSERFPLELHIVFYSKKLKCLETALTQKEGVAVFGVLFKNSLNENPMMKPLLEIVNKIQDKINVNEELLVTVSEYLPRDISKFYCYHGSLTTPNCTEGVIWTIFTDTLLVCPCQVKRFTKLMTKNHKRLTTNARPLQELHERNVFIQEKVK